MQNNLNLKKNIRNNELLSIVSKYTSDINKINIQNANNNLTIKNKALPLNNSLQNKITNETQSKQISKLIGYNTYLGEARVRTLNKFSSQKGKRWITKFRKLTRRIYVIPTLRKLSNIQNIIVRRDNNIRNLFANSPIKTAFDFNTKANIKALAAQRKINDIIPLTDPKLVLKTSLLNLNYFLPFLSLNKNIENLSPLFASKAKLWGRKLTNNYNKLLVEMLTQTYDMKDLPKLSPKQLALNNYLNSTRGVIDQKTTFDTKDAYSYFTNFNYKFNSSPSAVLGRNNNLLSKDVFKLLKEIFLSMSYIISQPRFTISPDKVIVKIFTYLLKKDKIIYKFSHLKNRSDKRPVRVFKKIVLSKGIHSRNGINLANKISIFKVKLNNLKLRIISKLLSNYFQRPVNLEIVRQHRAHYNSTILVNLLGRIVNKVRLFKVKFKFFKKAKAVNPTTLIDKEQIRKIPSYISGMKIRIAGRLMTQRVVPRKTVKLMTRGSLARAKVIYLDTARFVNKNNRGAFSITINTGHVMFKSF